MNPSLYIHIPFCAQKCIYCDFYSVIYKEELAAQYCRVLLEQVRNLAFDFPTIYIGGGTPTALDSVILGRLLKGLEKSVSVATEVTIEANPESLSADKIELLLDHGVNRISIGVQSLRDKKLKALGRIHTAARAEEAVCLASKRGCKNISIDLIFGAWTESPDEWKEDIERAVKLPVTHVSAYGLTYEKGTPLSRALGNKSVVALEDEVVAGMYEYTIERLAVRGFKHYEVSSYAKDGFRCRHNLRYWENEPYVGLGASAVSYTGGVRGKNVADVAEYIRRFEEGRELVESSEKLSPVERAKETAAIKIRTKDGIDFAWFREKTGFDLQELGRKAIPDLIRKDLIKYRKDGDALTGICLRRKGFLFCDTVSSALL